MLKFYDYKMMKIPEISYKCDGLKYVIIENENDEKECLKICDEYIQNNLRRTSHIIELINCISRRHTLIDYAIENDMLKNKSQLLYPNIWMYNTVARSWVLMNDIISDATKLNSKLKSKTEIQIRNSNSDSEIENGI